VSHEPSLGAGAGSLNDTSAVDANGVPVPRPVDAQQSAFSAEFARVSNLLFVVIVLRVRCRRFEMDDAEAAELAAAIRMSLESTFDAQHPAATGAGTASTAPVDVPTTFHFVTECFFLALQGVHVGVVPFLQDYQLLLRDVQKFVFTGFSMCTDSDLQVHAGLAC
jgi:hypothetical protein